MPLPETLHDQDNNRVIHHELGHWLMAREMGFEVGKIVINSSRGKASGYAKVFPRASSQLDTAEAVDDYLSRRVRVLLAGVIVEIAWYKKTFGESLSDKDLKGIYENAVIDRSGIGDKGKAEELLAILAGIRGGTRAMDKDLNNQIRVIFVKIYRETEQVVETFLEMLFVLADLISSEPWQDPDMLEMEKQRLTELVGIAVGNTEIGA